MMDGGSVHLTPDRLRAAADEADRVAHAFGTLRDARRGLAAQLESTHDPEDKPYRIAEWTQRVTIAESDARRSLGLRG